MAVPVINSVQTVLAFSVGQNVFYQLAATDADAWRLSSGILPPGIVFNVAKGTLSGKCSSAGVWNISFIARNSDGDSSPVVFVIGIFDLPAANDVVKNVTINTDTWNVTFPDVAEATGNLARAAGGVRYGDTVTFQLFFQNSSGQYIPKLNMARFSLKGLDTEPAFIVSREFDFRSAIVNDGIGYVKKFFIVVSFEAASLYSFLADYENDSGTLVNGLCEFEFLFQRSAAAGFGGVDKITTNPFYIRITRDSIA